MTKPCQLARVNGILSVPESSLVLHEVDLKKKLLPIEMPENSFAVSFDDEKESQLCQSDVERDTVRADFLLAQRCVAGEVTAWEQIYAQCHKPLLTSVKIMLGPQGSDANLVDEVVARVWYALVAKDGELLARYKPDRGARLITFMRALAKDEMASYFRKEIRRRNRELSAMRERSQHQAVDVTEPVNSMAEFLGTLTPCEMAFCSDYLLAEPSIAMKQEYSRANIWQLTHRIRCKLLQFLDPRL